MNNSDENSSPETISLVTAINRKYGVAENQPPDTRDLLPTSIFIKIKTSDHLPGKRRASGSLELMVLNDKNISDAGDLTELAILVRNITQLDLAKNSFSSWDEVCRILALMPLLEHCNLSHNPLSHSTFSPCCELNLSKLNSLVLNGTQIGFRCLFTFLHETPNLEELHLSLNDYGDIESKLVGPQHESFPNIHVLHINHCQLNTWNGFLSLCRLFPCLETVVAADNNVDRIGEAEEVKEVFGCLHALNINKWPIKCWDDVDRCRNFPLLSELRINQIPLLDSINEDERRFLMIARLPDVTVFNGSAVTALNREDAERFFIRFYVDREDKPKRYFELENIHGQLNKLLDVDLSPKDEAEVRLVFEDESRISSKIECRRISLNQSVGQFKKSLQTFCGLPPTKMKLWYLDIEAIGVMGMEELRFPKQMLHSLRVADGDEFHIQAKPEPVVQRRRTSSSSSGQPSPVKH